MDSRSDNRRVSPTGEAARGSRQETDTENLEDVLDPDEPCFTEAELKRLGLLPVPEWARKPPGSRGADLFDDQDE